MAATACDHLMQPVAAGAAAAAEDHETKQKKSSNNQVVCFGELLVDFVPTVCGLALGDVPAFKTAPGGAPANVAVGICKLGGNAAFIGKIGDDEFGYALVKVLKKHGVETRGVRFESQARTALAFVSLRSDGERQFMFYRNPSADMLMVPGELDSELISSAGIFHYGSISLISEPCRSTHLAALKIAKEANVVLSYDPNLRLPLWSSPAAARAGIMSIWQQANIIKVSDEEVKFLTSSCSYSIPAAASDADHVQTAAAVLHDDDNDDDDDETVLNCLWHPDLKLLLVTYGADGCRYYTPSFKGKVASLQVQAVDTTGAGDAFVAGLLSKLVQDFSLLQNEARLRQALQFANACGAITTTERGAIPALPDTHTVLRSLSSKLP